ncbi:MAG: serine hydroxymethyltransferase [Pseudomonadota bacterium]
MSEDSDLPYFTRPLSASDPLVAEALVSESKRQQDQIELIASENMVSRAVLDALGHEITNKTLEGYPGNRFHGGGKYADICEQAAIDRAKALFNCEYANVQPHSGTQANQAVFFALLKPGDSVLSMELAAGGHLSHGAAPNQSGRWFNAHHYGVNADSGLVDYNEVERLADNFRPRLLIAGGSAYPRRLDFARLAAIAKRYDALFLVDMAHIAGLVAGQQLDSPLPHADIVTCTTTKTLRGPRGGLILSKDPVWSKKLQSAIFPGVQGSLHTQILAAKAVCLGEALDPAFRNYTARVVANAQSLAAELQHRGLKVITDGTDTHMVLLDFEPLGLSGQQVQDALESINITTNKNPVPGNIGAPSSWTGLRLGSAAATTRGFGKDEFSHIAEIISHVATALSNQNLVDKNHLCGRVGELCARFPIY